MKEATFIRFNGENLIVTFPGLHVVSRPDFEITIEKPNQEDWDKTLNHVARIASQVNCLYGTWYDVNTGVWHFDLNDLIRDKHEAMTIARKRNQSAVWRFSDNWTGDLIRVSEYFGTDI